MKNVGEIFKHEGKTLIVHPASGCDDCVFLTRENNCTKNLIDDYFCGAYDREDHTSIIFKLYNPFKFGK